MDSNTKEEITELQKLNEELQETLKDLNKRIDSMSKMLDANLSYANTLKFSLIRGFGAAIGATILIGIAIYGLDIILSKMDEIPLLTPILEYIQSWLEAS